MPGIFARGVRCTSLSVPAGSGVLAEVAAFVAAFSVRPRFGLHGACLRHKLGTACHGLVGPVHNVRRSLEDVIHGCLRDLESPAPFAVDHQGRRCLLPILALIFVVARLRAPVPFPTIPAVRPLVSRRFSIRVSPG